VRNDDSIVIELTYGDVSILLTGDICGEGEQQVASRLKAAGLRLIKVPHHGSRTSSSPGSSPPSALESPLSAPGAQWRASLPSAEVLKRYRDTGAHIFRTDEDGAVEVETDGRRLEVRTFTGRRLTIEAGSARRP
jgi:competence protein ComEC